MSYAVNSGTFWVKTETKVTNVKKNKKSVETVNPIFGECEKICDNQFWKNIFANMSIGKFPKKFTFKNNILMYRVKTTKSKMLDIGTDPTVVKQQVISFLNKNGNIMSEQDRRKQNERVIESLIYCDKPLDEKDVFNNKRVFSALLCQYVFNNSISVKDRNDFLKELTLANTLGLINEGDVEFSRDEGNRIIIKNIKTVTKEDDGTYKINKPLPCIEFSKCNYKEPEVYNPIEGLWSNYIKWLSKKDIIELDDNESVKSF